MIEARNITHSFNQGARNESLMKQWPSQPDSRPLRKIGKDSPAFLHKTYAAEFLPLSRVNFHPQGSQGIQRLRHHPLSTRFFNGRRSTIRDHHLEALLACRNGGSKPRWPSANYENVCALLRAVHSVTFLYINVRCAPACWPPVKSS